MVSQPQYICDISAFDRASVLGTWLWRKGILAAEHGMARLWYGGALLGSDVVTGRLAGNADGDSLVFIVL